ALADHRADVGPGVAAAEHVAAVVHVDAVAHDRAAAGAAPIAHDDRPAGIADDDAAAVAIAAVTVAAAAVTIAIGERGAAEQGEHQDRKRDDSTHTHASTIHK